ncbi:uncharacterized protein LOC101845344 [Aplysia californica]|uniref:Uncharacterized protein LOC101845344 n=1 Tax=Aplysia californica TaxID=6500 RepID=A0ABM0JX58_APLCA|nr:uncharacterized protein LOC101845344 [Aplysia californica]
MSNEDRAENRQLKEQLKYLRNNPRADQPDFTIAERKNAIVKMKSRVSPGPDNIPPSFLKKFGPKTLEKLLSIFNMTFRSADVQQFWKDAIIVPLLTWFSLTSCVINVMEIVVSERLYDMAERSGWFSELQAGFRKRRGVEDQILRITKKISDGFQKKEKSALVLLYFSKANDMVW